MNNIAGIVSLILTTVPIVSTYWLYCDENCTLREFKGISSMQTGVETLIHNQQANFSLLEI